MIRFFLILIVLNLLNSCGKKGPLEYPNGQAKPSFEGISDEMNEKFKPKKEEEY